MMRALNSVAGVFAIFAIIMLAVCGLDSVASFKTPIDLYAEETNINELGRTDAVEAEVYAVLDCFAIETTTTKKNGAVTGTSKDYYYIIPAYDGDEEYYIGVKASSKAYKDYESIADLTWEWLSGEAVTLGSKTAVVEGCLKEMDDELYDYMVEWFEEAQWFTSDSEMEQYVLPVCLEPVNFSTTRIMFLVAVAVLIICVVSFVLTHRADKKQEKKAKEQTHVVINGVSYPKATFDHVNRCILNRERIFAVQELRDITGLELEEAQKIIDNWNSYYFV